MKTHDMLRLLFLSALWGGSFIFIRIAAPVLGPIYLVELRVVVAGLTLLLYAMATKRPLGLRTHWRAYLVLGAINSAIPFVLISTAELRLTASTAAVLNATSPLFGALIAAIWIHDPFTLRKFIGLVLGITGVAIVVGLGALEPGIGLWLAVIASLTAAFFYGLGSVFTKARVHGAPMLGLAAGSQLGAGIVLAPLVPFAAPAAPITLTALVAALVLALACTALAYVIYFQLIANIGPTGTLTVTFLAPVFGVLWAFLFLHEPITLGSIVGSIVILIAAAFVTGFRIPFKRPSTVGATSES